MKQAQLLCDSAISYQSCEESMNRIHCKSRPILKDAGESTDGRDQVDSLC